MAGGWGSEQGVRHGVSEGWLQPRQARHHQHKTTSRCMHDWRARLVPQKGGALDVQLQQAAAAPGAGGQLLEAELEDGAAEVLHLGNVDL